MREKTMNYYEILEVSKTASPDEIKSSYKKLVKKYHPDLYKGDKNFAEQKIKEINEAYDVLSNPEKKLAYDESFYQPVISTNDYDTPQQTSANFSSREEESPFNKFVTEKLEHLTKKRQIQIFFVILAITFILFLINLWQLNHYLTSHPETTLAPKNSIEKNTIHNNLNEHHNNYYPIDDSNSFENLLNNYMKSYFEEYDKY